MWHSIIIFSILISINFCISGAIANRKSQNPDIFECVTCDSALHGNKCFSILGFNAKYRECPSNQCYTSVIDDTIKRGCIGDDFITNADACSNDSNCELCSSSTRCNSHRIDYEKCFSYELSENVPPDVPATLTKVCPLGVRPMGCYHQVLPLEKKIRKGCVIELAEDVRQMCRANGDFCKTCFTDICNFRGVLQTCVTCDSASNPNCLAPDESVPSKHCSDYNDKCYTFTGNNEVKRGCLQEANKEFIASCRDTDKNCKLCFNDELCNKNAIVDTCITCDSENDQRCLNNPESFGETICSVNNLILSQGCYLKKIGEQVKRGCADALPNLDFIGCNENSQYCQKCRRRNCNLRNKFQQECISCDSEQDDRCTMMKHGESFKSILCKNYLSTCLVGINSGGHTYRGCSTDSSINDKIYYSKGFEICSDEKCNEFIFPKDRLLCYQCNGSAECDFNETSNLSIEPVTCKHYTKDDKCYAYVDKDKKVHRGCMSDRTETRDSCKQNGKNCKTCSVRGCNNLKKTEITSGSDASSTRLYVYLSTAIWFIFRFSAIV